MGQLVEKPSDVRKPTWQDEAVRFRACPWWMRAKWASICLCIWAFVAMSRLGYSPTGDVGIVSCKGVYYSVSEGVYWSTVISHSAFAVGVLSSLITLVGSMIATDKKLPWNYRSLEHSGVRPNEVNTWWILAIGPPIAALAVTMVIPGDAIGMRKHEPEIPDYEPRSSLRMDMGQRGDAVPGLFHAGRHPHVEKLRVSTAPARISNPDPGEPGIHAPYRPAWTGSH